MDNLTEILGALEVKGWLYSRTELTSPWRFDFLASLDSIFHVLNVGSGYLTLEGEATSVRVERGDVLVFPSGHAHTIRDTLSSPLTRAVQLVYSPQDAFQVFRLGGEQPPLVMLCGAFHFEHPADYPFLQSLPKVIHIRREQGRMVQGFAEMVHMIVHESVASLAGREVVLRRLSELLLIQVIRAWIEQQAEASSGWVAALRDQPISAALGLIHQSPERGWKVEELARAVGLSRSAFSARFTQLVGEPPMTYVTRWRMRRAKRLLKNDVKIETIAKLLGYESEVAFRQAFKREIGIPPARYRRSNESNSLAV